MNEPNGIEVETSVVKREASIAALGTNPNEIVESATAIAKTLAQIVKQAKLATTISGRQYVMAEGWTTLGAMLSVFPQVEWTRRVELPGNAFAWESRVYLAKPDGRVIASAEAMAASNEGAKWCGKEYSVRSMAQTRATGKAFRLAFSWIMTLAGFEPTPAEEMPQETKKPRRAAAPEAARDAREVPSVDESRSLALSNLGGAFALLYRSHPKTLPYPTSDRSEAAQKARAGLLSQAVGRDVPGPSVLTTEELVHANKQLREMFSLGAGK